MRGSLNNYSIPLARESKSELDYFAYANESYKKRPEKEEME
jgi:hypothetical protein